MQLLGRGGFGSVYLTLNKLDKVQYAVKKIHIYLSKANLVMKILREVTVLAKLSHPNIVSYKTERRATATVRVTVSATLQHQSESPCPCDGIHPEARSQCQSR